MPTIEDIMKFYLHISYSLKQASSTDSSVSEIFQIFSKTGKNIWSKSSIPTVTYVQSHNMIKR